MEMVCFSEILASANESTYHQNPEDSIILTDMKTSNFTDLTLLAPHLTLECHISTEVNIQSPG
jgi:hypothetical protein